MYKSLTQAVAALNAMTDGIKQLSQIRTNTDGTYDVVTDRLF